MLFKDPSFFSCGGFFGGGRSVWAILVEGIIRNSLLIFLYLGQQFRRRCLKIFLFLGLVPISSGVVEQFGQFGRGPYEEHLDEIILNLGQQFSMRFCLRIFSIFSSAGHFVWRSRTIWVILVEGLMWNILNLGQYM